MLGPLIWGQREGSGGDDSLEGGMGSTSGEYVGDRSSLLSLQPWVFRKESCGYDDESIGTNGEFSGRLDGDEDGAQADKFSPRSVRVGCGAGRRRSSLRSRRDWKYSVRTLGSNAGNCLVPQLYDQQFEIEEYVFSSPPQTEQTTRPCVVTDGKSIISKSSYVPVHVNDGWGNEVHGDALGAMGVPRLPVRTPKRKSRDARCEGLDTSASRRYCNLSHSQGKSWSPIGQILQRPSVEDEQSLEKLLERKLDTIQSPSTTLKPSKGGETEPPTFRRDIERLHSYIKREEEGDYSP